MNYLALCQRLKTEAGISGTLASVSGQTGELARVLNWINTAYESIQNSQTSWNFMKHGFTVNTVIGTDAYAYGSCTDTTLASAIVNFGHWDTDSFQMYKDTVADENVMPCIDYELWKSIYRMGSQTASRPSEATILPNDSIGLGPKPDAVYVFSGDYYRSAAAMSLNADIPVIPSQYHMAIVWRALMLYAQWEEADNLYQYANREYMVLKRMLDLNQLPKMNSGGPLA
jgi:hypothetical protein